jgi:gluconokinase
MKATENSYGEIHTLYASGGFTQSKQWLQILSDIFNKKIIVTGEADASALGAAIIGLHATGLLNDLRKAKDLVSTSAIFEPNVAKNKVYKECFEIFESITPKIQDSMHALQSVGSGK